MIEPSLSHGASASLSMMRLANRRQPGERHADPSRPVGALVDDFVGGLFDEEEFEQRAFRRTAAEMPCLPIVAQESA